MKLLKLLGALAIVVVVVYALRGTLLPPVAGFLDVSTPLPPRVDYVVPLPGDDNTRTLAAAALMRQGRADKAAVLQGVPSLEETDGQVPSGAEITRGVLVARGIPEDRILLVEGESSSTYTDLQLLGRLWDDAPQARVAIVSNAYHLRRVRWSARQALPDRFYLIYFVAAPIDGLDDTNWWQSQLGVSWVVGEYFKWLFYIVQYGTLGQQAVLVAVPVAIIILCHALVTGYRRLRVLWLSRD